MGFLTGSLQNFARKYQLGIDTVSFDFVMVDIAWEQIKEKPADGVFIRGLFLEGARWDPDIKSINDSRPGSCSHHSAQSTCFPSGTARPHKVACIAALCTRSLVGAERSRRRAIL